MYEARERPRPACPQQRPLSAFVDFHVEPQTHLFYSATWASLSVLGAAITYARFLR